MRLGPPWSVALGLLASLARAASAQDAPGPAGTPAHPAPPAAASPVAPAAAAVPPDEALRLDEYLNRLDDWRRQGRITTVQAATARRVLQAAILAGDRSVPVPLDASGRIDLLALARGTSGPASASAPPGDRFLTRIVNEFDLRMQVRARDLAAVRDLALFDAAPGYASLPARELVRIVRDALETTPLDELPAGHHLAAALGGLPNMDNLKTDGTIRELGHLLSDRQRDWMRSRLGTFLTNHRIEAGLIAFGAITGLRLASPSTARVMDRFRIRLRFLRASARDARVYATGRLIYRHGHVLPELELESGARRVAGPVTLRTVVGSTVGAEAAHRARGRIGLGARWERGRLFADATAMWMVPDARARTEWRAGYLTDAGFAVSGAVAATVGRGAGAVGRAAGRLSCELDLSRPVLFGRAGGEAGVFIASSADSDFTHADWRGGVMFRVRY